MSPKTKKADVAEHPEVLHHAGLLLDEPPRYRVALHLVVRRHNWQSHELRDHIAGFIVRHSAGNAIDHGSSHRLYPDLVQLRLNREGHTRGLCGRGIDVHHVNEETKLLAFHRWDRGGLARWKCDIDT